MNDDIFALFVRIDKIFGGSGNKSQIVSDIKKIERKNALSLEITWRNFGCNTCTKVTKSHIFKREVASIQKIISPDLVCKACQIVGEFLMDDFPLFIYIFDVKSSKILFVARTDEDSLGGYSENYFKELGNSIISEHCHKDDIIEITRHFQKLNSSDDGTSVKYRVSDINGNYHWVENFSKPLLRKNGELEIIVGYSRSLEPEYIKNHLPV